MKLLITHELHAHEVNGHFYNQGESGYGTLCNYRHTFNDIVVIVRCRKEQTIIDGSVPLDGEGISICAIPEPSNLLHAIALFPLFFNRIRNTINQTDRYFVRLPGPTGTLTALVLICLGKKYGSEFVGHATESYLETRKGPLVEIKATFFESLTRFIVKHAHCVAYRSQYLRRLYPNKNPDKEWVFSGAQLDETMIGQPRSRGFFLQRPFNLIYVGRLMPEKGLNSLLHAFQIASSQSTEAMRLHLVGDGKQAEELKVYAADLGVNDRVIFHGRVARYPDMCRLLDESHLFVLPSLTEGMPRSLIEAMARGTPALGSSAGGIVELLEPEYRFAPGNAEQIAENILTLIGDSAALEQMSCQNYEAAKEHWPDKLANAKDGFWQEVEKSINMKC